MYFTDADMDTLTWSAMSDMEMYATATVDTMGMVTITGVAAGTATITVKAMDPHGEYAMQTITVTVEAEPEPLEAMAPTGGSVSVLRSQHHRELDTRLCPGHHVDQGCAVQ